MHQPEYISAEQIVPVLDPRPVEPKVKQMLLNKLSPFSQPSRTTQEDLDTCEQISQTISELGSVEPNFSAHYKGAVAVGDISFAWDGVHTVIRDDISAPEANFLQNIAPVAKSVQGHPQAGSFPREFSFFSRFKTFDAEPIQRSNVQNIGRVATTTAIGVAGFKATDIGLHLSEFPTFPILSDSSINTYGGMVAATLMLIGLRVQRRRERRQLVQKTKSQVLDLDKKIHNPEGGIVFPRDSGTVSVGIDKERLWADIYEGNSTGQNGGLRYNVSPVKLLFTALKMDANPNEFWKQGIGDIPFRDYAKELAGLCVDKDASMVALRKLQEFARKTGVATNPNDVNIYQQEIDTYQEQMDIIASRITELVTIRQEQQQYILDQKKQIETIPVVAGQNDAAIQNFANNFPAKDHPQVAELFKLREILTAVVNLDLLVKETSISSPETSYILNRLTTYMKTHEPGIQDAAEIAMYRQALHDKFVSELPSLSAALGLPAPKNSSELASINISDELAGMFDNDTKVHILNGLVCATTDKTLSIYGNTDLAWNAASLKDPHLGTHIKKNTPIENSYTGIEFIHVQVDKIGDLGITQEQLLPLFGKEYGKNSAWVSYTAYDLILRSLRKVDDAQILWEGEFGETVRRLALYYDVVRSKPHGHKDTEAYQKLNPLGLDVLRSYLAYVQPKVANA